MIDFKIGDPVKIDYSPYFYYSSKYENKIGKIINIIEVNHSTYIASVKFSNNLIVEYFNFKNLIKVKTITNKIKFLKSLIKNSN